MSNVSWGSELSYPADWEHTDFFPHSWAKEENICGSRSNSSWEKDCVRRGITTATAAAVRFPVWDFPSANSPGSFQSLHILCLSFPPHSLAQSSSSPHSTSIFLLLTATYLFSNSFLSFLIWKAWRRSLPFSLLCLVILHYSVPNL